jgi:23S rRNA pseudouridine955/2504/2580 synthase
MIAGKMTDLFREHKVRKTYHALVEGRPRQDRGTIDAPLRKASTDDGERMVVDAENGLPALTRWHVLKHKGASRTWLALEPEHGRTHQLRVHCAHIGLPIAGDGKYGVKTGERLHLHAYQVRFPHPLTGHPLKITAELPPHMAESWGQRS